MKAHCGAVEAMSGTRPRTTTELVVGSSGGNKRTSAEVVVTLGSITERRVGSWHCYVVEELHNATTYHLLMS